MKRPHMNAKMVKLLAMLFSMLLPLLQVSPGFGETLFVVTNGDYLNGRARPDKNAPIEARFDNGDAVEALSIQNGWVEVIGGETGTVWCKAEYLSDSQSDSATYRNTSGGRVFVRSEPSGKKTGRIDAGKKVKVSRQIGNWGYIGSGWVDLSFFERLGD